MARNLLHVHFIEAEVSDKAIWVGSRLGSSKPPFLGILGHFADQGVASIIVHLVTVRAI